MAELTKKEFVEKYYNPETELGKELKDTMLKILDDKVEGNQ